MSLNGLDDVRVKEAHEAAVAEPGGWFLLKYASRDEVELLGHGNGGIVEIRNNIAQYEEKSPLYGFLRYRRRNVIIKYLPEDCSRLVQARVTVQFDSVCDRFSPHDTIFEITDAKELKDTKLSAACSLHAASGSTSSSTSSLRRRRLMEITEEEEEEERDRKRQSTVKEEDRPGSSGEYANIPPVTLNAELANGPDAAKFANSQDPPQFTGADRPSTPSQSFDEAGPRMSSQSARADPYLSSPYYLKPRVKLGPRPSAEVVNRPRSAGGGTARPVSTVPAKLKALSKGSRKGRAGVDEDKMETPIKEESEGPFQGVATTDPSTKVVEEEPRPHTSSGVPAPTSNAPLSLMSTMPPLAPAPSKQTTMTPEKARLLKAMKLREKKKLLSVQPDSGLPDSDIPSATNTPGLPEETPGLDAKEVPLEEATGADDEPQDDSDSAPKADAGLAIEVAADQASVDSQLDSHPASPLASSEIGGSTQASSLSESTDETILGKEADVTPVVSDEQVEGNGAQSEANEVVKSDEKPTDSEEPILAKDATSEPAPVQTLPVSRFSVAVFPSKVPGNDESIPAEPTTEPSADASSETKPVSGNEEMSPPSIPIPISRFSTVDTKSPTTADDKTATNNEPAVPEKAVDTEVPTTNTAAATAEPEPTRRKLAPEPINLPEADKRQSTTVSLLDNDGLMEELGSATVEQATPVTVSKSPVSSYFPNDAASKRSTIADLQSRPQLPRTVSNPVRSSMLSPSDAPQPSPRSVSSGAAYLQKASQQALDMRPKISTAKIGSSIAQRIKALEKQSSTTGPIEVPTPKDRPSSAFFAVRKVPGVAGAGQPLRSPSVLERTHSLSRRPTPSPPGTADSTSDAANLAKRERSGSVVNRLSMFEGGLTPRGRPESIQVTARIVRDPYQPYPKAPEHSKTDPADYGTLDLKQSPLTVDQRMSSPVRPYSSLSGRVSTDQGPGVERKQSLLQRRFSKGRRSESQERNIGEAVVEEVKRVTEGLRPRRRSSLTVVKDFIKGAKSPSTDNLSVSPSQAVASPSSSRPPSVHQTSNNSIQGRLSFSSRRSSIDQNATLSPIRTTDTAPESENEQATSPNKSSRTTRFMRRLSNTLVPNRKTVTPSISPTVAEENAAEVEAASRTSTRAGTAAGAPSPAQPSIVAFMGDVNVQFPDNLLWKRRSICLDSQGFLILSAVSGTAMMPSANKKLAGIVKRYHMSDFKTPYTPDVELQELPNSVVLDFVEGSGLQIACEDRAGQMNILHILVEAHQNHNNY
ncbi:hypothetical protein QBC35DRAFT_253422 [Podospora australis]|uniref:ADF-H domain-containing protein n=1 Tax=Podospora australis TaxID=1536484 RepID=A0AAN7AGX7_9PEZI|nr:hypothetical protein QBC35DRAFT_253422 [Podospora australis]